MPTYGHINEVQERHESEVAAVAIGPPKQKLPTCATCGLEFRTDAELREHEVSLHGLTRPVLMVGGTRVPEMQRMRVRSSTAEVRLQGATDIHVRVAGGRWEEVGLLTFNETIRDMHHGIVEIKATNQSGDRTSVGEYVLDFCIPEEATLDAIDHAFLALQGVAAAPADRAASLVAQLCGAGPADPLVEAYALFIQGIGLKDGRGGDLERNAYRERLQQSIALLDELPWRALPRTVAIIAGISVGDYSQRGPSIIVGLDEVVGVLRAASGWEYSAGSSPSRGVVSDDVELDRATKAMTKIHLARSDSEAATEYARAMADLLFEDDRRTTSVVYGARCIRNGNQQVACEAAHVVGIHGPFGTWAQEILEGA
jgi:hypothetical protein